jgi:acyl carrier protein
LITLEQVITLIRNELRGKLPEDTVIDENSALGDLGLSSLQIAEIVFELEEEHGVEFDAAQAADAKTLGDLIELGNLAITKGVA